MKTSRLVCLVIGSFFLVSVAGVNFTQAAEEFPAKYVTVLCGFSAGGSTDLQIRGIAPYAQKYLGKAIMVENIPGANGLLSYNQGFSVAPDGYTLVVSTVPALNIAEKYFPENAKFQAGKYSHIFAFARDDLILVGHPEMFKGFREFLDASKSKKLKVGISGKGQPTHLAALMLEQVAKIETNIIPFEGGSESLASLAGKHIDAVITFTSTAVGLTKSGMVKPLLIIGDRSHPGYPNVPSAKDMGYDTSKLVPLLFGVLGPPNIPGNRVKILESAFAKAVEDPTYVKWATGMNIQVTSIDSAAFLKETLKGYPMVEEAMKIMQKTQ